MKKVFVFLFVFIVFESVAQLKVKPNITFKKVGECFDGGGNTLASLQYHVSDADSVYKDGDTVYVLRYRNYRYSSIISYSTLSFLSENGEIDQLYKLIKTSFTDENKANKDFKLNFDLGKSSVIISRVHGFKNYISFRTDDGYFNMKERNVDQLFGKN